MTRNTFRPRKSYRKSASRVETAMSSRHHNGLLTIIDRQNLLPYFVAQMNEIVRRFAIEVQLIKIVQEKILLADERNFYIDILQKYI